MLTRYGEHPLDPCSLFHRIGRRGLAPTAGIPAVEYITPVVDLASLPLSAIATPAAVAPDSAIQRSALGVAPILGPPQLV